MKSTTCMEREGVREAGRGRGRGRGRQGCLVRVQDLGLRV